MKARHYGRAVTVLVWTLVSIGLLSGVITSGLVGWTLLALNRERVQLLEQEKRLAQRTSRLQQLGPEVRGEIHAMLQGQDPAPGRSPLAEMVELAAEVRSIHPEPVPKGALDDLDAAAAGLAAVRKRTADWLIRYRPVAADLNEKATLNRARQLLESLRAGAEMLEGGQRLKEALLLRQWREASGEAAGTLARAFLGSQMRHRARALKEVRTELSELSRLVETLAGEDQLDHLSDLKDNQLKPLLERLERQVQILKEEGEAPAELSPAVVAELQEVLFGRGHAIVQEYQTIRIGEGGLYRLASDALHLRRERDELEAATQEIFGRIEAAHPVLAAQAVERGRALASRAEESLSRGLSDLLAVGVIFLGGFLGLGGVISHKVRRQVITLGQAEAALQQSYLELDALNHSLERKVTERTLELEAKHAELIRAQEELARKERLAAIGSLAAGVAHEINNPAAIIRGNAEILRRKLPADGPGREEANEILQGTERISRITQNLLIFAREQPLRPEGVDVNQLLGEILAQAPHQIPFGNVQVVTALDPHLPTLKGDREKLRQVFTNLVINALEAMKGEGTLTVASRPEGGGIRLTVGDSGPGISAEERYRIFHPFYTTKRSGTGLGLSVSYGIVQALGGSLEVESETGAGAAFNVFLPMRAGIPSAGGAADPEILPG